MIENFMSQVRHHSSFERCSRGSAYWPQLAHRRGPKPLKIFTGRSEAQKARDGGFAQDLATCGQDGGSPRRAVR